MTDEKVLKDAQFRKGLSIAFFNATNAAIEWTKNLAYPDEASRREKFLEIRNWMLDEHRTYWATVINNAGGNFKPGDAITKLQKTTSYDELSVAWRLLSEDERRDPEIIKVAKELKTKFVDATAGTVETSTENAAHIEAHTTPSNVTVKVRQAKKTINPLNPDEKA